MVPRRMQDMAFPLLRAGLERICELFAYTPQIFIKKIQKLEMHTTNGLSPV